MLAESVADRPKNFVHVLPDGHGAWTLGCYGNPDIGTPHLAGGRWKASALREPSAAIRCAADARDGSDARMRSPHGVVSLLDPKFMLGPAAGLDFGE